MNEAPDSRHPSSDPVLRPWFRLMRGGILLLVLGAAGMAFSKGELPAPDSTARDGQPPGALSGELQGISALATLGGGMASILGWLKVRTAVRAAA